MQPRQESRIESLEKRASTIEATLVELSSDTAEELKVIHQDISKLDERMQSGFLEMGQAFDLNADNIEVVMQDVAQIKIDVAELKGDITSIKATQEQILALLQQKSGE